VSAGYFVMLCVLCLHFGFVCLMMFILGTVLWVSSVSDFGYFFGYLVVLDCVVSLVSAIYLFIYFPLFLCDGTCVQQFCCIIYLLTFVLILSPVIMLSVYRLIADFLIIVLWFPNREIITHSLPVT
jgi:hypothetical protein